MKLNPIPPDQYWWNAAGLHFQLHDYKAAIAAIDRMSDPLPALRIAAASWAYLGDRAQARKCAAKFLRSYPDFRIEHWLKIVPNRNPDDRATTISGCATPASSEPLTGVVAVTPV